MSYTRDIRPDAIKAQRSILSTRSPRMLCDYFLLAYSPTLKYLDFVFLKLGSELVYRHHEEGIRNWFPGEINLSRSILGVGFARACLFPAKGPSACS